MLAGPACAQGYEGCDQTQAKAVAAAMAAAKSLTVKAAARVGDTPEYERWFGAFDPARAETVRGNLKAVVSALRSGGVTVQCDARSADSCGSAEYAWVYPHEPFHMHLCPSFFQLPTLVTLEPGSRRSDNGTREGTIVHELSHFQRVADTEDYCYSRQECRQMAADDIDRAINNADSYQYFTEDVTYYARQPVAGKPTAAKD